MSLQTDALREEVRQRAGSLCEYCHTNERWQYVRFTVDHILPVSRGGSHSTQNLALACLHCNRYKSNRTQADDPETGESVPIFNPRTDEWGEHFEWSRDGIQLRAKTSTGRATIDLLQMNRPRIHEIRAADLQVGRHPPSGDPIANK